MIQTEKRKMIIIYYLCAILMTFYLLFIISSDTLPQNLTIHTYNTTTLSPLNKKLYYENSKWMYNSNIMQYSAYVIVKGENSFQIESNFFLNYATENIICLARLLRSERTLVLDVKRLYSTVSRIAKKISCELNINHNEIRLDEIGIAVIIADEYSNDDQNGKFPYSMINYQIPEIIEVREPRLPDVGLCINYVSNAYQGIYNWVELHKQFKIAEIIMHDGSPEKSLKRLLNNKFDSNFLNIRDYNLNYYEICESDQIKSFVKNFPTFSSNYMQTCKFFHQSWFAQIDPFDNHHNHLSPNDCYSRLSYKYEFVALYDLDELIIPRSYDPLQIIKSKEIYECEKKNKLLINLNPISTSMYDYIKRVVKENFNYDISKLRSIGFFHGAYLLPNNVENKIMNRIQEISSKINTNSLTETFPIRINFGFELVITEDDKDYVVYLNKLYKEFTCYYDKYLSKIANFDKSLIRYLYFMTGPEIRLPKSIHYSKNVQILFTHDAHAYNSDSFILYPPWNQSHINSHFRADLQPFFYGGEASIRDFSFDFEYSYFLLKNYTNFCKY